MMIGLLADGLGELLKGVIESAFTMVLWFLDMIWVMVRDLTKPNLSMTSLRTWAQRIFYISMPLLFIFFIAQVLLAVAKQSLSEIWRGVLGVMIGVIGTAFSLPLVAYLTRGADGIADALIGVALRDVHGSFSEALFGTVDGADMFLTLTGSLGDGGGSTFAAIAVVGMFSGLFMIIVVLGCLALFLALLIRTNLLYVMVVIGPIMLAGLPWRATHVWARRWVSLVVALIFTKLGVVIVLAVGTAMLSATVAGPSGSGGEGTGVLNLMGTFVGAGAMLTVAALAPVGAFRFFDFLGESTVASLHADARQPVDMAKQAASRLNPGMLAGHTKAAAPVEVDGEGATDLASSLTPSPSAHSEQYEAVSSASVEHVAASGGDNGLQHAQSPARASTAQDTTPARQEPSGAVPATSGGYPSMEHAPRDYPPGNPPRMVMPVNAANAPVPHEAAQSAQSAQPQSARPLPEHSNPTTPAPVRPSPRSGE